MHIEDILKKIDRIDLFDKVLNSVKTNVVDDRVIRLDLGNMNLSVLPLDIFEKVTSLNVLYLNNNQLNTLPKGIFDCLPSLRWLDLGRNHLIDLLESTFVQSPSLRVLGLHNNQLTSLPKGIFEKLNSLTIIDLSNNQLKSLPIGIFDGSTILEGIALSGNQLPYGLNQNFTSVEQFQNTHSSVIRITEEKSFIPPITLTKNKMDRQIKKSSDSMKRRESKGRTITVYSPEPVEGKTVITLLLAFTAAKKGFRTVIIDGNVETPELNRLLKPPKSHLTWVDFLTQTVKDISKVPVATSIPNLDVIFSPTPKKGEKFLERQSKDWWKQVLKRSISGEARLHEIGYDLVFVDNQFGTSLNSVNNMVLADTSVMVLNPATFGMRGTNQFSTEMYRVLRDIKPRIDFYVWNQLIKPSSEEETKYLNEILQQFNQQLSTVNLCYGGLINLSLMFHLGMGQTQSVAHHLEYFFHEFEVPIGALLRLLLDEVQ